MKVLLINPPRENEIIGNNPSIIEEERGFNPPLGLLYIAAYLEKHTEHEISVIDAQVERLNYSSLAARISEFAPDIAGLTTMTMTLIDVMKTAGIIKQTDKNIKVVLGGPHVHLFPEESVNLRNVDYIVLGEGEEAFKDLLDHMDNKQALMNIAGLVFKEDGNIIHTGLRPPIKDLDRLPFPARHLVPYKKYTSLLSKGNIATTVFTSRGCPFKCTFCDRPHLGKVFRARSAGNVVDELELCSKLGIHDFLFYDDTFTVNKKRVMDICNEIVKRKLDIGWDIRARIDTVDEEMLKNLKKAGCRGIHYGIEAGTEKILKVLNKRITILQAQHVFDLTRKYRIPILAYFMIGNPAETRDDIFTTFSVMKELDPDYVHMTILTPFPGTKIYFDGLKNGIIRKDYWKEFAEDPKPDFIPPHWDELFSRNELNDLLVKGYKGFYIRPSYILKRIGALRSFSELKKKAAAGLKVFFMKQFTGRNIK
ncbi:MAG TPA: radical SAM protein [Nitrospirae bacterium]|nr:(Dimethylallyl)adenosine tRNA methylthiotransferase MiaB [bacterium BMS3Abin10]GBE38310.1 (Dimethylallyl)adenosine tRNA methylthiotransferase MiaB [bacterium BMS3Bbin08]HDH49878.1 radical SAM protein [Nitrospirota bacterium]HDK16667.1 radical SAM protein [Nitrospirota bacterium]HDO26031.1 radical SAM protein [Nitrospirota bacterium]